MLDAFEWRIVSFTTVFFVEETDGMLEDKGPVAARLLDSRSAPSLHGSLHGENGSLDRDFPLIVAIVVMWLMWTGSSRGNTS